jgi:hypothetical protein
LFLNKIFSFHPLIDEYQRGGLYLGGDSEPLLHQRAASFGFLAAVVQLRIRYATGRSMN